MIKPGFSLRNHVFYLVLLRDARTGFSGANGVSFLGKDFFGPSIESLGISLLKLITILFRLQNKSSRSPSFPSGEKPCRFKTKVRSMEFSAFKRRPGEARP